MALRGWRNLIADSPPVLKGRITDGEHHALFAQGGLFVLGKILSLEASYPVIGTPARNSITVRPTSEASICDNNSQNVS